MMQLEVKTTIYSGLDCFERLETIKNKRVWLVCDPFLVQSEALKQIKSHLVNNQIQVFSDVIPDPPIEKVALGINSIKDFNPEIVIALGGGSAIDQAKGILFVFRQINTGQPIQLEKFIAIPTTSGTGSEVTSICVLTDSKENRKYPILHPSLAPDEALLNPSLVITCPPKVTAFSGLDVLSHALEALVAKGSMVSTDALAEKAIDLVLTYLKQCFDDGSNIKARTYMHEASCIAGIAFNNAGLGICHALSHQIGGIFHLPHGLVNAILLPEVVEFNAKNLTAKQKYAAIARKTGLASTNLSDSLALQRLVKRLRLLNKELDCPQKLSQAGVKEFEAKKVADLIGKNALLDMTFAGNPIQATEKDLKQIYLKTL